MSKSMEDVRWPIEVGYFMVSYLRYYEFTKHGCEHGGRFPFRGCFAWHASLRRVAALRFTLYLRYRAISRPVIHIGF